MILLDDMLSERLKYQLRIGLNSFHGLLFYYHLSSFVDVWNSGDLAFSREAGLSNSLLYAFLTIQYTRYRLS